MIFLTVAVWLAAPAAQDAKSIEPTPVADSAAAAASASLRAADAVAAAGITALIAEAPEQGVLMPRTLYMPVLSELYPAEALRAEQQGLVRLQCTLSVTGTLQRCAMAVSSGVPSLDAASFEVARFARYSPRIVNRVPEASEVVLPVRWVLAE